MILDGSENSWMVMSTTPQIFLGGNENSWMGMSTSPQVLNGNDRYHPRIFTTIKVIPKV